MPGQQHLVLQRATVPLTIAPRPARRRPLVLAVIGALVLGVIAVGVLASRQLGLGIESSPAATLSPATQAPAVVAEAATALPTAVVVPRTPEAVAPPATSPPSVASVPPTPLPVPTVTAATQVEARVEAPPPSPEQQLSTAQAAIERGDFPSAFALLGALRETAPTIEGLDEALYRAHLGYGQQLFAQGLLDESYGELGEALKLRPDDPAGLEGQKQVVLAKLWSTMEVAWDKDEAVASAALEEILATDPNYRDANVKLYALLVARADRLVGAGDTDGAVAALRRARDVYPEGDEARARLEALTAPTPEPTPAPAPAAAPRPAPTRAPAPAPAPAPKPIIDPSQFQPPPGLPPLPKPGSLPGLPLP